jgi:predicted nucleic acid-binding protein
MRTFIDTSAFYALLDCVSFEVMRNSGAKTVFAFDLHFKEQGFSLVPA